MEESNSERTGVRKVLLAFSGGTDSCYSAVKLSLEGYSVEALVLDMTGDMEFVRDAAAKAATLGLKCTVADVREEFRKKITDYFTGEYLSGRTPAPCTLCNFHIKWKVLYEIATKKGFDHIATGHYFNITDEDGRFYVAKAADDTKDQSYYLWMLPQEILSMALTPMGGEIKKEVVRSGSAPMQKESMGVCFLRGRDYREYVKSSSPPEHPSCGSGTIKDREGNPIGRHDGCAFYTIGQKKGLGLPAGYSVTVIDAATNTIIAGGREDLYFMNIILENHIITPACMDGNIGQVKVRGYGINPRGGCWVKEEQELLHLAFEEPVWAPAKGQPVVFYDGDTVTGGGFICGYF